MLLRLQLIILIISLFVCISYQAVRTNSVLNDIYRFIFFSNKATLWPSKYVHPLIFQFIMTWYNEFNGSIKYSSLKFLCRILKLRGILNTLQIKSRTSPWLLFSCFCVQAATPLEAIEGRGVVEQWIWKSSFRLKSKCKKVCGGIFFYRLFLVEGSMYPSAN